MAFVIGMSIFVVLIATFFTWRAVVHENKLRKWREQIKPCPHCEGRGWVWKEEADG